MGVQEIGLQPRKKVKVITSQDGVWGMSKWHEGDCQNDSVQHALKAMKYQ